MAARNFELELEMELHDLEAGRSLGTTRRMLDRRVRLLELELDRLDPEVPDPGIDLKVHYEDVRRLTSWRAGSLCRRNGWDLEDLIADVVLAVAIRNRGTCPWDRRRGTLATYLIMIVNGVVSRRLQKDQRRIATVSDSIAVDGEEMPSVVASTPIDLDELLDARTSWTRLHDDHGVELDALTAHGTVRGAARACGITPSRLAHVAARARAALGASRGPSC